ncbi:SGNH/GDSL hydrolase family protein [Lactiplantibacillus plantarum]|uniref:SGNH/GDSL hydrolase family protein n=1 Tax=Lactiplantibacillus plantarum TaxID=1590 RepID=UPI00338F4128
MAIFEDESNMLQGSEYRDHLNRNWDNGNDEFNAINQRINTGGRNAQSDEVANARIDIHGTDHKALATRLDSDEVSAETALKIANTKAGLDYVQNLIGNLVQGSPRDALASVAEMSSKYPKGVDSTGNHLVIVNTTDGYWYYWNGNAWTKGPAPYQSSVLADGSITFQKLESLMQTSAIKNATFENVTINAKNSGFFSVVNQKPVADDECNYTDKIAVNPGDVYTVSGTNYWDGRTAILFDAQGNIIASYPSTSNNNQNSFIICVPTNATKMIINQPTGTTTFVFKVSDYNITQSSLDNLTTLVSEGNGGIYTKVDLTPKSASGYWEASSGSYLSSGTDLVGYELLPVSPLEQYKIQGTSYYSASLYNLYDYAGKLIATYPGTNEAPKEYTKLLVVPQNARFMAINQYKAANDVKLEKCVSWSTSTTNGKNWAAIGDSLTDSATLTGNSAGATNYVNNVADSMGLLAFNLGVGGTGYVADNGTGAPFSSRSIPSDADVITVFGSFNDVFVSGFSYGDQSSTDTKSLWGAAKALLNNIWSANDKVPIGIISPTPWSQFNPQVIDTFRNLNMESSKVAEKYVATLRDIANYYSLPFLDLYHASNLRPWDSNYRSKYYRTSTDGTHPNSLGHGIITPKIVQFIKTMI